ncbi:unnamed protein product [Protopolystoma xenopodis]|uniref:Uncharacterized protein n=1 Tax=Protopolystoma xenopodis TaxID=117903 RepID=A0A3S5CQ35_9PLAT|nr:unnamed protein product [Protopolystoma xenopodis]
MLLSACVKLDEVDGDIAQQLIFCTRELELWLSRFEETTASVKTIYSARSRNTSCPRTANPSSFGLEAPKTAHHLPAPGTEAVGASPSALRISGHPFRQTMTGQGELGSFNDSSSRYAASEARASETSSTSRPSSIYLDEVTEFDSVVDIEPMEIMRSEQPLYIECDTSEVSGKSDALFHA